MAILRDLVTNEDHPLLTSTRVGRDPDQDIRRPNDRDLSRQHALIEWMGTRWLLRDLNSTNGTFVDGVQVGRGGQILTRGARIGFGSLALSWEVTDDGPPRAFATATDGRRVMGRPSLLAVPEGDEPTHVFREESQRGWTVETMATGHVEPVDVDALDQHDWNGWRVVLPRLRPDLTRPAAHRVGVEHMHLVFHRLQRQPRIANDDVEVDVVLPDRTVPMPALAHHRLLYVLAKERRRDDDDDGWIDQEELQQGLGWNAAYINIQVFRAREKMIEHQIPDNGRLIERRPRQLRLGVRRISFR